MTESKIIYAMVECIACRLMAKFQKDIRKGVGLRMLSYLQCKKNV